MDTTLASASPVRASAVPAAINRDVALAAVLIAVASVIGLLESAVPPIAVLPWLRLGLANIAVVMALSICGGRVALAVALGRVVVVGLLAGTIATPTFIIAVAGAVSAVVVMTFLRAVAASSLTEVGLSAAGSVAHVMAQLAAGSALIGGTSLISLAPPSALIALLTGTLTGLLARATVSRIRSW